MGVSFLLRRAAGWRQRNAGLLLAATFPGADNPSSLGLADTGQSFTVAGALTFGIQSNQAYAPTVSGFGIATADVGQADMDLTCDVVIRSAADQSRGVLILRSDGTVNNRWTLNCDNTGGNLILSKVVAGTSTNVRSVAFSVTNGTIYTVRVLVKVSAWTVWVGGVQITTATDSALGTLTRCGFGAVRVVAAAGSPTFDNLRVVKPA